MYFETRTRSLVKTLSWRTSATLATIALVLVLTGRIGIAVAIGGVEVVAKLVLYFVHERVWEKIRFGKREVPASVLWFTGLPSSGKTAADDEVHDRLEKRGLKVERLDAQNVRPLFPETGYSPEEVDRHIRRGGHLASVLERQGITVICAFVSPYRESREFARSLCENFVEIHMDTTPEAAARRDLKGNYEKARRGEPEHFPGVTAPYEEPPDPELRVPVGEKTASEIAGDIIDALKGGTARARRKGRTSRDAERRLAPLPGGQDEA